MLSKRNNNPIAVAEPFVKEAIDNSALTTLSLVGIWDHDVALDSTHRSHDPPVSVLLTLYLIAIDIARQNMQ